MRGTGRRKLKDIALLGALWITAGLTGCAAVVTPASPSKASPSTNAVVVSLSPASASVQVSQSQQFAASVQNDSQSRGVTWTLTQSGNACSAACGSLSGTTTSSASYAAPATVPNPSIVTLTATSVADNTKSASAQITVTPQPASAISVSISPVSSSVQISQSQQFSASIQNDSQNMGVTWALTQAGSSCTPGCGSLPGTTVNSAVYLAPATLPYPSIVTLTATSIADSTKSFSSVITVTTPASNGGGPSGWVNITDYGARAFSYPAQRGTCSIASGSTTLSCAGPLDWINGDGIRIDLAGPVTKIQAPTGIKVTPIGVLSVCVRANHG